MFKKITRKELEKKLEELKKTMPKDPNQRSFAMCYSRPPLSEQLSFSYKCAKCEKQEEYIEYAYYSTDTTKLEKIIRLVEKIKELGYNAELLFCCPKCSEKKIVDIIFRFKTENDENYLETNCYQIDYYAICLEFLEDKLVYENWEEHYSANEINQILHNMLGVNIHE